MLVTPRSARLKYVTRRLRAFLISQMPKKKKGLGLLLIHWLASIFLRLVPVTCTLFQLLPGSLFYCAHFEITGGPCNLIGSNWCDLFTNRTFFCFEEATLKTKQPTRFQGFYCSRSVHYCEDRFHIHVATFVLKTLIFSPQKMDEFNFKPAQWLNLISNRLSDCVN